MVIIMIELHHVFSCFIPSIQSYPWYFNALLIAPTYDQIWPFVIHFYCSFQIFLFSHLLPANCYTSGSPCSFSLNSSHIICTSTIFVSRNTQRITLFLNRNLPSLIQIIRKKTPLELQLTETLQCAGLLFKVIIIND